MRGRTPFRLAIGIGAVALLAAGCTSTPAPTVDPNADAGGTLRIYASEPAFLVPTAADDDPSIQVIRQVYRGLVKFNKDTGDYENDLAESISSSDNTLWTIKIKSGYKFTNGEAVNSDSFIRAWNYAAYAPNAQNNAYFMSKIKGIEDVSFGDDPDGDGPAKPADPKSKELSGLKKVDDSTFTVELSEPFAGLPAVIGYSGFFPVAKACLDNFDACNETPIGNGPYKIDGKWDHDVAIDLVRNDEWPGGKADSKADKLHFQIFSKVDAGYDAFQAGELDVMYTIPSAKVKAAQADLGDRFFQKPSNTFTYVGYPLYDPNFQDKRIRQAISMVIDRQAIIDAIFDGRFTPATGLVSPNFAGARANVCKYCKKDVDAAKALLAAAGGWKGGKLQLWANAGADHEKWLQAVGDQIKAALGIDYELKVNLQFAQYLETADNKGFTGPFRLGWGPDYPYIETYLAPLYATNGSSNNSKYSSSDFDNFIKQANAAKTQADGIALYQKAEDVALEDMPVIPMWFGKVSAVYGDKVGKFVYNTINGVSYGEMTLKK
jgi:ABC-type oligopeptide transport system substrate-binding subunit